MKFKLLESIDNSLLDDLNKNHFEASLVEDDLIEVSYEFDDLSHVELGTEYDYDDVGYDVEVDENYYEEEFLLMLEEVIDDTVSIDRDSIDIDYDVKYNPRLDEFDGDVTVSCFLHIK